MIHTAVFWGVTLPTFQRNILPASSECTTTMKMQTLYFSKKLVTIYQITPKTEHEWGLHLFWCWNLSEDWDEDRLIIIKWILKKFVLRIKWTKTWPSDCGLLVLAVLNNGLTSHIITVYIVWHKRENAVATVMCLATRNSHSTCPYEIQFRCITQVCLTNVTLLHAGPLLPTWNSFLDKI